MTILLTGADGFTGRHFASLAQSYGHHVVALKADLTKPSAVQTEVTALQPTHVLHLAAISFVGHADERAFYDVNLFGTINLLEALIDLPSKPASIILASSANVYGNCTASPIAETQLPAPSNHYGISKLTMEHAARLYMDRLPMIVARPFNYTGPGQNRRFVIPKLINHFREKAPAIHLGDIAVEREFNDVQFVCEAYLQLLRFGKAGETYNVCSGTPYTLTYVIEILSRLTGHELSVKIDPAFVRANEVHSLCGDPTRLQHLLIDHQLTLGNPPLAETLQRMLESEIPHPVTARSAE